MFAGGLIISCTLMLFAVWLHRTEKIGWPNDTFDDPDDRLYLERRSRSRRRVNALFFFCGLLIFAATLATPERRAFWIAGWLCAMLVLCTILVLAGFDILRTMLHHRHRIGRARKSVRD